MNSSKQKWMESNSKQEPKKQWSAFYHDQQVLEKLPNKGWLSNWGVGANWFYLLLYSKALKTVLQLSFEIATKPEFHIEFIDSHVLWCGKLLWGTNSTDGNKSVHSLFNTTHIIFQIWFWKREYLFLLLQMCLFNYMYI